MYFCLLVLVVNSLGVYSQTEGNCKTPSNEDGSCVPLQSCPMLRAILEEKPLNVKNLDYLQKSNCGYVGNEPNVCCPPLSTDDREALPTERPMVRTTRRTTERPRPTNPPPQQRPVENLQRPVENQQRPNESPATAFGGNSYLLPTLDYCGQDSSTRIIGGENTEIDEFPWMALLEYKKPVGRGFYCGGVLINSRYILTAAHCVKGKDIPRTWKLVSIRLGEYNTETDQDCVALPNGQQECTEQPINIPIAEAIAHEDYDPEDKSQKHDIALLRLHREAPYTDFIKPICLPGAKFTPRSQHFVAGWGKTETRSESPIKLKVKVPLVDHSTCSAVYQKAQVTLGSGQMCAGGEHKKDSCRGDSGGSLMTISNAKQGEINWFAEGIVSFGPSPCGTQGWPGVYTKVENYMEWIVNTIKP